MNNITKHSTFFVDIDGTLVKYRKFEELSTAKLEPIQEVVDFINKSYDEGCHIVITTARTEPYRLFTKQELDTIGLKYHQIIMGLGRGTRVVVNDKDPENPHIDRAVGINLVRNQGFTNVDLDSIIKNYESK
jgi:hydroxymethylpyrimidine pyrophosphatase-like HAD family hydrolase